MLPVAARPRSPTVHFQLSWILPIAVYLANTAGSCYTADRPEVSPLAIRGVAVIPSTVYVIPGATFVLRARVTDDWGGVIRKPPGLDWTVRSGLTKIGLGADSITLRVDGTTPATILVDAKVGEWSSSANVHLLAGAPGTLVSVVGDIRAEKEPDVVLIDNGPNIDDSLIAFVGTGLLGNLTGAGEVWRFANDQAFAARAVTFQTPTDIIDLRTLGAPGTPAYTVWIATSASGAVASASDAAEVAAKIFGAERTGLALHSNQINASGTGSIILESGAAPCDGIATKLHDLGIPAGASSFKPESLNVVYVDDLIAPPESDALIAVSAMWSGYTCPHDATIGRVVLISQAWSGASTHAHELGHAFGLGDTEGVEGIGYTNMMWGWEVDGSAMPRGYFTLGQAFRINLDDHSWLPQPVASRINCDQSNQLCPFLKVDVR